MNNKGLGRGLGSLFAEFDEDKIEVKNNASEIDISLIDRNEDQPRKKFDENGLNELAQSIKEVGIIQPLVLSKMGSRYLIVAGERRFRAAKIAGIKSVPAIVREYSQQEIREIALIENLQREDLNPIESARAINELISKHNVSQEALAKRLGKSRPSITNSLRLLTLSPEVVKMVENGTLSAGHARVLVVIDDEKSQIEIAKLAQDGKMSVRQLEKFVKDFLKPKADEKPKFKQSAELRAFAKNLQDKFATKVTILGDDKKGRIFIDYNNSDDLDRIYSIMKKI